MFQKQKNNQKFVIYRMCAYINGQYFLFQNGPLRTGLIIGKLMYKVNKKRLPFSQVQLYYSGNFSTFLFPARMREMYKNAVKSSNKCHLQDQALFASKVKIDNFGNFHNKAPQIMNFSPNNVDFFQVFRLSCKKHPHIFLHEKFPLNARIREFKQQQYHVNYIQQWIAKK